jgi:hypothetical protein
MFINYFREANVNKGAKSPPENGKLCALLLGHTAKKLLACVTVYKLLPFVHIL